MGSSKGAARLIERRIDENECSTGSESMFGLHTTCFGTAAASATAVASARASASALAAAVLRA